MKTLYATATVTLGAITLACLTVVIDALTRHDHLPGTAYALAHIFAILTGATWAAGIDLPGPIEPPDTD
jgi:hypothetical protein